MTAAGWDAAAETTVATVVGLLVRGHLDELGWVTPRSPLSVRAVRAELAELGGPLEEVQTPLGSRLEVVPAASADGAFDVAVTLSVRGREAPCVLRLRLTRSRGGAFVPQITGFGPRVATEEPLRPPIADMDLPPAPPPGERTDEPIPEHWRPVISAIVDRLVVGDYDGLVAEGLAVDQTKHGGAELGYWIEDHPGRLVPLPPEAWEVAGRGPSSNEPDAWRIWVRLWVEEGDSDLVLQGTVREHDGEVSVVVDIVNVP